MSRHPAKIVSFSGIDGAGKSTQILALEKWLRQSGLRTKTFTFWDDVVVLSKARESMSYKAFKGERGVGSPEKPVNRRDKNVSSPSVTIARIGLYLADAIHLAITVRKTRAKRSDVDVVIFDRYIYDELANLPLAHGFARTFAKFVMKFVPAPDAAFVVDADPVAAQARKPEYPLEFVCRNRESYLTLANISGKIRVVGPDSIDAMKATIRQEVMQILAQFALESPMNQSVAANLE